MDPTAALIMGGASLLGGSMRNKEAQRASARQMAFQKEMSDTAYQRAMADMRKAGLNPILAGKLGGASTPTGSTYNPTNIGSEAVQGAMTGAQMQGALATAKDLENKANMSQMDLDWFKNYNKNNPDAPISPMLLKHKPTNILFTKWIESFSNKLKGAKGRAQKARLANELRRTMARDDVINYAPNAKVVRRKLKSLNKKNIGGYHFYPLSED
jgi:isochorismate synthase EntC